MNASKILKGAIVAGAIGFTLAAPLAHAGTVEDAALTAKAKAALIADAKAPAANVNVESRDGVVQLNGYVGSEAERIAAEKAVRDVKGVQKVENNLTVRTATRSAEATVDDAAIATRVKAALAQDAQVPANDVVVEVRDGNVQLGGFVKTDAARQRATEIASGVEGVRNVDNRVDVRTSGL